VVVVNPTGQASTAGQSISLKVAATDSSDGKMSCSACGLATARFINAATGLISGTFTIDAAGPDPYPVTVNASDGTYSASVSFDWQVAELNLAPADLITVSDPGL
jgi:hypothetical protein